jgi:uncharacterized membrane protein
MGLIDLLVGGGSLLVLFAAGRLFLAHSVYRDFEGRNPAANVLFAAVFALSACMMELLVFEIMDVMDVR